MRDEKQFVSDLLQLDISLSGKQMDQFMQYYELLIKWNSFMNLTAITDFEDVMKKHFVDSLYLAKVCPAIRNEMLNIIDIGTGAGFPGLPLKIAFPQLKVTLLDSLQKRIKFLEEVKSETSLNDICMIHGRAEDYAKPGCLRENYDVCVSRAVANLSTLTELCLPYVKVGGVFISYKTDKINEEAHTAKYAITTMGGKIDEIQIFNLPESDITRSLIVIKKIKKTPTKYPRKAGTAAKEPIIINK